MGRERGRVLGVGPELGLELEPEPEPLLLPLEGLLPTVGAVT